MFHYSTLVHSVMMKHVYELVFKLNDGKSISHEGRLHYPIECLIFRIEPIAMNSGRRG